MSFLNCSIWLKFLFLAKISLRNCFSSLKFFWIYFNQIWKTFYILICSFNFFQKFFKIIKIDFVNFVNQLRMIQLFLIFMIFFVSLNDGIFIKWTVWKSALDFSKFTRSLRTLASRIFFYLKLINFLSITYSFALLILIIIRRIEVFIIRRRVERLRLYWHFHVTSNRRINCAQILSIRIDLISRVPTIIFLWRIFIFSDSVLK